MIYKIVQDVKDVNGNYEKFDVLIKEDDIDYIETVLGPNSPFSHQIVLKRDIEMYELHNPDTYVTKTRKNKIYLPSLSDMEVFPS